MSWVWRDSLSTVSCSFFSAARRAVISRMTITPTLPVPSMSAGKGLPLTLTCIPSGVDALRMKTSAPLVASPRMAHTMASSWDGTGVFSSG